MSRIRDKRSVVHYYFWDTWFRYLAAAGAPAVANGYNAFGGQPANLAIGNKYGVGVFPDNNVFKILSMRVMALFYRCASAGASSMGGAVDDLTLHHLLQGTAFFTLRMSQKDMFEAPAYFLPAGGGISGDIGTGTTPFLTNGVPSPQSMMQFARPFTVSPQQLATVRCDGVGNGAANIVTDVAALNAGMAICSVGLDGIFVRAAL